ncbi:MAG: hypothetical protein ACTHJT_02780 [Cytophaga sp.]|uniref:hypothetical protein n=1 Tax=Cytophaga sp. TaxID=29535 RepID=UPI003F800E84
MAIKLKKGQFLVLKDKIIRSQDDTVVYLPSNTDYKKRKDYERYKKNKYVRQLWDEIYLENQKFIDYDTTFTVESENPYAPYEGKIIRNIYIKKENVFDRDIYDTVFVKKKLWIEKVSESLHEKTKTFVVRNNLFIKNDSVVDQNRLADNERLLRTLPYMHDARIFVKKVRHSKDSVDIEVIVQDLWTIGGSFTPNDINYYQWKLYDENFLGLGQSITYRGQYRSTRTKPLASEFTYMKNNAGGTFINPYIRYSELNGGLHVGKEDEASITLGALRPIYMPTARLAGGYFYSNNWSVNETKQADTSFYHYKYNVNDIWGGVTFSGFKNTGDDYDIISRQNRARLFLSMRYFNCNYVYQPNQENALRSPLYNNNNLTLGQATYFRYDFYKTRYIYGFGRTEDVPYGYSYLINSGVQQTLEQLRYYLGAATFNSWVSKKGDFFLLDLRASAFYNSVNHLQDFFVKGEGTYVSKIKMLGRWKSRFYFTLNYAKIIRPQLNNGLNINDANGIQQFFAPTLLGYQTSSLSVMTNLFPRFRLLGFRFAFVMLAQVAQVGTETEFLYNNKLYSGLAAGFRTKNENLVFDEFDLRFYFFPNAPEGVSTFKIVTSTTPRLRINLRGIDEPSIIGL